MTAAARRLTTVLACAAGVLLSAPALAHARSDGFDIVNRTGSTLVLQSITTPQGQPFEVVDGVARRPAIGTELAPNAQPLDVELRYDGEVSAKLTFAGRDGTLFVADLANHYRPESPNSYALCSHSDAKADCDVSSGNHPAIRFLDPPGMQRVLAGTEAQTQMTLLSDLCRDGRAGACSFASRDAKPIDAYAPATVVGEPILNCGDTPADDGYTFSETVKSSNSIGSTFGGTGEWSLLVAKIGFSIKYSYNYEWGHSRTFAQDVDVADVPAKHIAYMTLTVPITRQFGTFVAQVNNTTWTLDDVRFDAPTRSPAGVPTASKIENRAATKAELNACNGASGIVRLDPSAVGSLDGDGDAKGNTLYADDAGERVLGRAGDDILIGGRGPDRLSGGPGDDNLVGGRGRDVLRGGPGSDVLQDTDGPTTVITGGARGGLDTVYVRDGDADDVVRCTTRESAVVADRGDRVSGPCGGVIRSGPVGRPPL